MKKVKNESLQGLEIFFKTEAGITSHWLAPKEVVAIPEHYITEQLYNLHRRKMVKIFNG